MLKKRYEKRTTLSFGRRYGAGAAVGVGCRLHVVRVEYAASNHLQWFVTQHFRLRAEDPNRPSPQRWMIRAA
jgi:hypothetical protein